MGGCEHIGDELKFQGRPADLMVFDELPHFAEQQYTFIIGWNRPLDPRNNPNQRCRVVCPGNPPTDPEGLWVLRRWAAWFPGYRGKQAAAGELRWYTTIDGEEVECVDSSAVKFKGQMYQPRSRTFIPARLEDNPDLMKTGYASTLEAMPEPLRSMLRYGDMMAAKQDDRWQLIPSRWVALAQRRWVERVKHLEPLDALGVDVAMQGDDATVIAPRHRMTINTLIKRRGADTPDGQSIVALMIAAGISEDVYANIDAIGIGKSAYDVAIASGLHSAKAIVVSKATDWHDDKVPGIKFANIRSAMMWNLRVLLDPERGHEDNRLALPPDPNLLTDLTAPRYSLRVSGVQVESKDDIRKRIGRSTDEGDSVALACWNMDQGVPAMTYPPTAKPIIPRAWGTPGGPKKWHGGKR